MFSVAVIGGGRMGRAHLRAIASSDEVQAVAVVEPSAEVASTLPSELTVYSSVSELLNSRIAEGAIVAAPSPLHVDVVRELARAAMPTLSEKPCGVVSSQTREAAAIVAKAGIPFQVGYWRRFVPALQQIRERIAAGEIGDLFLVSCWQWDGEPASAAFRAASGGICVDMGVHEFDQVRWLTGQEFAELHVVAPPQHSAEPVPGDPESLQILATLSGGTAATVSLGRRYPPGDICKVEVYGTSGADDSVFLDPATGEEGFLAAIKAQTESFARYAQGAPREGASIEDAVAALEVAERAATLITLEV